MLRPRKQPFIYRQGNTWHLRVYVPPSVQALVGAKEQHRTLQTEVKSEAEELAIHKRNEMYRTYNSLLELKGKSPVVRTSLSEQEISSMAREVYLDYRSEVESEFVRHLNEDFSDADNPTNDTERAELLADLLSFLDPLETAKMYAKLQAKKNLIVLDETTKDYAKLVTKIKEGLIQSLVDFVNNLANTPGRDDNAYFIDVRTKEPIPPSSAKRVAGSSSYLLGEHCQTLLAEISNTRGPKGIEKIKTTNELLVSHFGYSQDVREISRRNIIAFREKLIATPTNMKKRYPGMSLDEAIKAKLDKHTTLSISTINTHMRNVKQLFNTICLHDDEFSPPNLSKLKLTDPIPQKEKRLPFSIEQLKIFFASINVPAEKNKTHHCFWCALIALYQGLRANEITGLRPTDFVEMDSQHFIDLKAPAAILNGKASGKTKTIPRRIPIHPMLLQFGILNIVEESKNLEFIFPNLREDQNGYRSDDVSDWASRLVHRLGWKGERVSFHSFRHNFADAMAEADLSQNIMAYLGGWKLEGVMNSHYGSKEMKNTVVPAIAKVSYGEVDRLIEGLVRAG